MNGFLLKNGDGVLGLAVIDDVRKIQGITYLSEQRNLQITLADGGVETLDTEIDRQFETALFAMKKIFVGHFPHDGFGGEPTNEYFVPLSL